jgi:hypothetical protein
MEIIELAEPPRPGEPLGVVEVTPVQPAVLGELQLALTHRFIPMRVGSTTGTTELTLVGRFGDDPQHPGSDCENCTLSEHNLPQRVRLGHYRWQITDVDLAIPRATVVVNRVALAPKLRGPGLADGDSCTFWLSTLGVDDIELEPPNGRGYFNYDDYVEIQLGVYPRWQSRTSWAAINARRVLREFENAYWEHKIEAPTAAPQVTALGDHRLELLELVFSPDTRFDGGLHGAVELHAQMRLTRGATGVGMTPKKVDDRAGPFTPTVNVGPR